MTTEEKVITLTAVLVKDLKGEGKWTGTAKLWRVDPPVEFGYGDDTQHTQFVVTSATRAMFSWPETYIFPADAAGRVLDWGELDGSYRGGLDHEKAIKDAGYAIVEAAS